MANYNELGMKSFESSVVINQLGVAGVPALGAVVRPWPTYVGSVIGCASGVHIAPMSAVLKQDSAVVTPATDATPRKDAFARSGIRTEGPPV